MRRELLVTLIVTLNSVVQGSSIDSNTLQWMSCNKKVDDCLDFVVMVAPKSVALNDVGFCHTLQVSNVRSLSRTGDASSRPCGQAMKLCTYQKLQFGLTDVQLNCTLREGLQDLQKYLPGVKILSSPPSIPASISYLFSANPHVVLPTSVIAKLDKIELKVEVMVDHDNEQYPVIETELISNPNEVTIWCEGSDIFQTLCQGATGHQKTRLTIGNLAQVFLKKMIPKAIKGFGNKLTTCHC